MDEATRTVPLYAPVWQGIPYRFARPIGDSVGAFDRGIPDGVAPYFSSNCIMNYLHGEMEGKDAHGVAGPITFGEIVHQQLNQTMVPFKIHDLG